VRLGRWGLEEQLVGVTPPPVLPGLERPDDRVLRRVPVRCGMAVGRTVAATDVTTGQAEPQVDPLVADAQTILATFSRRCDLSDLVSVFTRTVHIAFLS
jgi:hypothetical protein